ncbi:MAG: hypothetical protein FOGNACKC_00920 [Anaerolineae bacterium]|nr:hypothetical protein [Anaerolineae bacterium]
MSDQLLLEAELALASVKANPYHDPKDGKFAPKAGGKKYGMNAAGGGGTNSTDADHEHLGEVAKRYGNDYAKQAERWLTTVPNRVSDKALGKQYAIWVSSKGHLSPSASSVLNAFGKDMKKSKESVTKMGRELLRDETYAARW